MNIIPMNGGDSIPDRNYEERVAYVMNSSNYTFRCPHCKKMNLPESQYCNYCGKAIGEGAIGSIPKRKMDFIMIAMETDTRILEECFQIVLKNMIKDELFMMRPTTVQEQEKDTDAYPTCKPQPRKRGRKPKNG
jgi:hypothetical protein